MINRTFLIWKIEVASTRPGMLGLVGNWKDFPQSFKENQVKMAEQKGFTLWFTGLSGAGKTTIATALAERLKAHGLKIERLDGDVVRRELTRDLGFSKEDRDKNIERVTFVARLLSRNGVGVLAAFISPYREIRAMARRETTGFIEVFVNAPLEVCIQRDTKGMYARAIAGEIQNFTGVNDPYEEPLNPEIVLNTHQETVEECVTRCLAYLEEHGYISLDGRLPDPE
jgi:adenylyl-sulfate kinase